MDELKPCPFCGSTFVHVQEVDGINWKLVHCVQCGADGTPDLGESGAIEAWNTRPLEDALQKRIVELEAQIEKLRITMQTTLEDEA